MAVALSGGGYRASAWALGVLWALVDSGLNRQVSTMASVSGGSITNAWAGLGPGYATSSSEDFAAAARAVATRLSGRPRAWGPALLVTLAGWVVAWIAIGVKRPELAAVGVVVILLASSVGAATSGDLVFNRPELWLYVNVLLALVCLTVWSWPNPAGAAGAVAVLAVVALGRGAVVGWCLGRSLRGLCNSRGQKLGDLNADPLHVFLATELRAGHHAAFSRTFIYCHDLGLGAKPSLPVRTAVQASSNLPGAFPTRWIRTADMGLQGGDETANWLALSDGGVYDNMGDQWPMGLGDRIDRLRKRPELAADPTTAAVLDDWSARMPTFVVVANASGALHYRRVGAGAIPLLGELLGLLQVKDVLYDNGNSVRRQRLIDCFDAQAPAGTLVHIDSQPSALACRWPDQERRTGAMDWLESQRGTGPWADQVRVANAVGTQFWPLGRGQTTAVIRTAYAQTMVNLHLRLGARHDVPEI